MATKEPAGYGKPKPLTEKSKLRYTGITDDKSGTYDSYRDADMNERLIAPATGKEKGAAGAGRGHVNYAAGGTVKTRRGYGKARGA